MVVVVVVPAGCFLAPPDLLLPRSPPGPVRIYGEIQRERHRKKNDKDEIHTHLRWHRGIRGGDWENRNDLF